MVDPSYIAFLWFAFTSPEVRTNKRGALLYQIWDDGERYKTRFRGATWKQFSEPPHLVSQVDYNWSGIELRSNGTEHPIPTSYVSDPLSLAVRYWVEETTNFFGLRLPLVFRFERFRPHNSAHAAPAVSSAVEAQVTRLAQVRSGTSLALQIPRGTYLTDYRVSGGALGERPLPCFLSSNPPPPGEELIKSKLFAQAVRSVEASTRERTSHWTFFILIIIVLSVFFWLMVKVYAKKNSLGHGNSVQS